MRTVASSDRRGNRTFSSTEALSRVVSPRSSVRSARTIETAAPEAFDARKDTSTSERDAGNERARAFASATLAEVRAKMGL